MSIYEDNSNEFKLQHWNQSSWKEQSHTQGKGKQAKMRFGVLYYLTPWILFFSCCWLTSHLPSFSFSITNAVRNTILSDLDFSSYTHTPHSISLLMHIYYLHNLDSPKALINQEKTRFRQNEGDIKNWRGRSIRKPM